MKVSILSAGSGLRSYDKESCLVHLKGSLNFYGKRLSALSHRDSVSMPQREGSREPILGEGVLLLRGTFNSFRGKLRPHLQRHSSHWGTYGSLVLEGKLQCPRHSGSQALEDRLRSVGSPQIPPLGLHAAHVPEERSEAQVPKAEILRP